MEKKKFSPYATAKYCVKAPKKQTNNGPNATVKTAKDDLRAKRG